ncbi:winged helix-turn-helix domain-containing protein [Rhizobium sp. BK538]|uniref:ATP-binding protein n=1 Tax=Rhizobium sp. BK538 TaxID=2586984 RepID=UPI0016144A55|nr:winged helix-turn-helix domain-containing protein [Rhizobium sp. BK538]MBB4170659.1 putative ATPase/DNA-binding winged helix-turn-helix (wHTH) protein [Rhizobium sp. BK538]
MTQSASETISFGAFSLNANERLLLRDGAPVELGSRAFDILVVLTERPNEVVGKKELLDRVWPDVTVEEGSLRFHIANLRKALGDGQDNARYISTLSGRGYCFVAPIQRSSLGDDVPGEIASSFPKANLPGRLARMVGRADETAALSALLAEERFVTVVGTGGIGKTTVAVAAGHDLIRSFDGAVHFVDLGALGDPCQVAATVTSTLGVSFQSEDLVSALATYLADKRILLILDTCEHVIEAAADLACRIFSAAPQLHIIATSREPLNVEGEHVYKLAPLACPPDRPGLTATLAQGFPAIELFMERAAAGGARLDLGDADAAVVAAICRKLDGVPLAIELAAGRVASHGIQKTGTLLNERLSLLWTGQRTAPPRQRTLQATLDWSSSLLSEFERQLLRRLSAFVGHFTIDAALYVVTNANIDETMVFGAFDNLVAKSMVATRPSGATMRYRLLDTTRAYALQLNVGEAEFADLAARHALYYMRWLEETGAEWPTLSSAVQRALHLDGLANARAALDWCFGSTGNRQVGIRLAAAAAPVFLSMSLLSECHHWTAKAIEALDDAMYGGREEMHLQAAMGVSLMFTHGGTDAARVALERSLAIAEERGEGLDKLQVLGPLQMFHLRTGEFRIALNYAERCSSLAEALEDGGSATLAYALMGISLHLNGEFGRARAALEAAFRIGPRSDQTTTYYLGFDGKVLAGAILARTLWLQGLSDQAVEQALQTIADAETLDHPLTLSIALIWAISVFLWVGDLERAASNTDRLLSTAELHSLRPYLVVGRGFMGELAIRRGDLDNGIVSLQHCIRELHKAPYELLSTPLTLSLLEGLAAAGRVTEALALVDETLQSVEANGDLCYTAELLRVKGGLVLAASQSNNDDAVKFLTRSLEISRRQGARAWELRTTLYLAALLADRDERENAREVLQPMLERFAKDPDSADLKSAARLLATLSGLAP